MRTDIAQKWVKISEEKFESMIEKELEILTRTIPLKDLIFVEGEIPEILAEKALRKFTVLTSHSPTPIIERWLFLRTEIEGHVTTQPLRHFDPRLRKS